MKHLDRCILATALVLVATTVAVRQSSAQPLASPMPSTAYGFELPRGVRVDFDGAGLAQVLWHDEVVAQLELVLREDHPDGLGREFILTGDQGARLVDDRIGQVRLMEGQANGMRGSRYGDDDQDGRYDEDPFDLLDNDGDGQVDEDFAAVGSDMRVSYADLTPLGLSGVHLRPAAHHWSYYHLKRTVFLSTRFEMMQPRRFAVAARWSTVVPGAELDETLPSVSSAGRGKRVRVRAPYARVERNGERLYLAALRLDGLRLDGTDAASTVEWKPADRAHWPIAILTAPTLEVLRHDAAQALVAFGQDGTSGRWTVPPLCGRCQEAGVSQLKLRFDASDDEILLDVKYTDLDDHLQVSHEGLRVRGASLGSVFMSGGHDGARYRVSRGTELSRHLLDFARSGGQKASVLMTSGIEVEPVQVQTEVSMALREEIAAMDPESEADFPTHLSPRLLHAYPNPFQQTTTIRYRVPTTLGEAFDFEDLRATALDLEAPPPFGTSPTVRVRVYNVSGQLIRILEETIRDQGEFSVSWDGSDEQGRSVAAGAYYVNFEVGQYSVTNRVLRLKP